MSLNCSDCFEARAIFRNYHSHFKVRLHSSKDDALNVISYMSI